ncbi:MAG: recombinase family protein [Alphaproteobacteria bacterium]
MARLRCAIYTRKSTEDGLDQAFNSLDAQHEACAAFITSQRHEGWRELPDRFDDGGYSGGTMERPGLARLLDLVRQNQVDVIVVYKVDRLTRSLADFAKMVALLDKHEVSFVSVTQQFNTTSSMGRLTLNVLLSFAQFEREVTAERIRDKIAASKKKGLWTGGPVPLGYDDRDRALVPNSAEAATVRRLYELYLRLGSVREVQEAAGREGIVTKRRNGVGARAGGNPFSRGALYALLSNQIYTGRIAYRGEVYEGQHEPIVDLDLWDAAQAKLKQASPRRRSRTNDAPASILTGLLYDETGDRLTPSHADKSGKRYRYYVSSRLHLGQDQSGWRLPAPMLENLILGIVDRRLMEPARLDGLPQHVMDDMASLGRLQVAAAAVRRRLASADARERMSAIKQLIHRIDIRQDGIRIALRLGTLVDAAADDVIEIAAPAELRRRGVETKIVLSASQGFTSTIDVKLIALVARAHRWRRMLSAGGFQTLDHLAAAEGASRWDVSRHLPLAFLAPDIVEAVLQGRQPVGLTVNRLKRSLPLPLDWKDQRRLLGFAG